MEKIIEKTGLSREQIKKKIDENIEEMSGLIDEEGALILVAKKLGVNLKDSQDESNVETEVSIENVKPRTYVSVVGRIRSIGRKKKFNRSDGGEGVLLPFVIADNTGMIRCVAWGHNTNVIEEESFAKNSIIRIVNGLVKEGYYGGLELNIGNKSRIQLEPDNVDMQKIPEKADNKIKITNIQDVNLNLPLVNVEEKVKYISPVREFTSSKTGKKGKRASLGLDAGDDITYITFWNEDVERLEDLKIGQTVRITELKPKTNFRDKNKIDLALTPNSKIKIVENVDQNLEEENQTLSIKKLVDNNAYGDIEAKIVEKEEPRTVSLKNGSQKKVQGVLIADETASVKINLWEDQVLEDNYEKGDVIKISGVYTKFNSYSKQTEANLSRKGEIKKIEKEMGEIKIDKKSRSTQNTAQNDFKEKYDTENRSDIEDIDSNQNYQFKGTIIKPLNRIYVYKACENCGRKGDNCTCDEEFDKINRMVLNCIVDDGSSTIRVTFFGDLASDFIEETADRITLLKEQNQFDDFLKQKNLDLLGKEFIFEGRGKYSDFSGRYEINATNFEKLDPIKESKRIVHLMENN